MYETQLTIIGNVLTAPEWRRTNNTGALVTTFKLASTARRLNRETGQWVDGNSLRVRIVCWRQLASNVFASVTVGDPLLVIGRFYTRDWVDDEGVKRIQYELEATSVGHDLSRGRNRFERVKVTTSTSMVEDRQTQQRVGGEVTEPVPSEQAPSRFDDTPYRPDDPPSMTEVVDVVDPPAAPARERATASAAASSEAASEASDAGAGAAAARSLAGAVAEPGAPWQAAPDPADTPSDPA
ncbi:single-stranded DNA-binding protein [Natronosporangium hydrolyticum]|uniref:Single-stranded DNA-binding protein n=1 Tax=Natronosporangium hydrolyticum TaxID=2811111 RepID=A0A895Y7J3_9ACTN|nr:single-stranded DNA-binding protein [Natronosporangium hydrolyticum]QSB13687.1 single-stranded DNA-binding protein [Natronosporangium hydrolyticum]